MTIEYIQRLQSQGANRNSGSLDTNMGKREWANDLTTWVIHNKMLYDGPNSLDQFCQAMLLHLQGMGSGNALASATSMLLNQVLYHSCYCECECVYMCLAVHVSFILCIIVFTICFYTMRLCAPYTHGLVTSLW